MNIKRIQQIIFASETSDFVFDSSDKTEKWLKNLLCKKYIIPSFSIAYIFVSQERIIELNKQFLQHDYPTDIISFDTSADFGIFGGDIYVCPEVIRMNAIDYKTHFEIELRRVLIHGILHFIGYADKTAKEQKKMRQEENDCLSTFQ